jgi:methyltransferase (TIGR00027 family)
MTELRDVSDTAYWVAAYRAEETERPDALFRDPHARRLAGERGFRLLDAMPKGRRFAWPMVLRTKLFDDLILERIGAGARQIVNLAAGLDARPYRLPLPADLRWVEVDLPPMIEHKSGALGGERPACALERVALNLADGERRRAFLAELGSGARETLVLTEGLLIYLERQDVVELAGELVRGPAFRWWLTDLASPGLVRMMAKTWGKAVERAGAPFRFAPPEGPDFFVPLGWRPARVEQPFLHAARAKRLPWPLRLLARLPQPKRFNPERIWSGVCLLERMAASAAEAA